MMKGNSESNRHGMTELVVSHGCRETDQHTVNYKAEMENEPRDEVGFIVSFR